MKSGFMVALDGQTYSIRHAENGFVYSICASYEIANECGGLIAAKVGIPVEVVDNVLCKIVARYPNNDKK